MKKITIGTRGSKLSLIQTDIVTRLLEDKLGLEVEIKTIKTTGDIESNTPLFKLKSIGIFEKEIDSAVLSGAIDIAVHSMKDLPTALAENLVIAAVPERASPHDVLISRGGIPLNELKEGAVIGTSSVLRIAELRYARKDLTIKPIRGNVETRVSKLENGEYDAIMLAEAGVVRLGLDEKITEVLPLDIFPPAAGQGALAIVADSRRADLVDIIREINDGHASAETISERRAIAVLGGGCEASVSAIGRADTTRLALSCSIFSTDSNKLLSYTLNDSLERYEELGVNVGKKLLDVGGREMVSDWKGKEIEV
jgi:hydroxymethylbilane synthase